MNNTVLIVIAAILGFVAGFCVKDSESIHVTNNYSFEVTEIPAAYQYTDTYDYDYEYDSPETPKEPTEGPVFKSPIQPEK